MSQSEKNIKELLIKEYIDKRNIFDKTLRKTEREYNHQVIDNNEVFTLNPRENSKLLQKLGSRKCTDISLIMKKDTLQIILKVY